MTLRETQAKFVTMLAEFLSWAVTQPGYSIRLAEAYRPPDVAAFYASQGRGIAKSLHSVRLAIDLILDINGVYQTSSEAYRALGEKWESLGGAWGGRFKDGNHFSLEWGGRK